MPTKFDEIKQRIEEAKKRAVQIDPGKLLDAATKDVGGLLTKTEESVRKGTQELTKAAAANRVPDRTENINPNPAAASENANTGGLKVQPKIAQGVGSSVQPGPLNASPKENTEITAQQVEQAQPQPTNMPTPGSTGGRREEQQPTPPKPSPLPGAK